MLFTIRLIFSLMLLCAMCSSFVVPPLSSPRYQLAATSDPFLMSAYFVGGFHSSSSASASIDTYKVENNSLTLSTSNIQTARGFAAATMIDSCILFVGGGLGKPIDSTSYPSATLEVLNLCSAAGSQDVSLSFEISERYGLTAVSSAGVAFFAGGFINITKTPVAELDMIDFANSSLTQLALSVARGSLASVQVQDLVLFAGGRTSTSVASAVVDVYNTTAKAWAPAQVLSKARYSLAAAASGQYVLFGGGVGDDGTPSNTVDIFDSWILGWAPVLYLSVARKDLAAASAGNLVIFAGGSDAQLQPQSTIDIFEVSAGVWRRISTPSLKMPRTLLAAATLRDEEGSFYALFAGGLTDTLASDAVEVYSAKERRFYSSITGASHNSGLTHSQLSLIFLASAVCAVLTSVVLFVTFYKGWLGSVPVRRAPLQ